MLCSEIGVNDGIRTRDNWNHNPGLYQLSYIHHNIFLILYTKLQNGAPDRIRTCDHPLRRRMLYPTELQAHNDDNIIKRYFADFKAMFYNIILNGRSSRIRTYDPLVPNQVHYQAVLCSDFSAVIVSHIVRYGVHSRLDVASRQHLVLKKMIFLYQMYI